MVFNTSLYCHPNLMLFTPLGRFFSFIMVKKSDIKWMVRADIPGDNRHNRNFIRKCLCLTEKAIQGMKLSNIHSIKTSRERKESCIPFSCCILKKKWIQLWSGTELSLLFLEEDRSRPLEFTKVSSQTQTILGWRELLMISEEYET